MIQTRKPYPATPELEHLRRIGCSIYAASCLTNRSPGYFYNCFRRGLFPEEMSKQILALTREDTADVSP